jgi:hypothetical protein
VNDPETQSARQHDQGLKGLSVFFELNALERIDAARYNALRLNAVCRQIVPQYPDTAWASALPIDITENVFGIF